MTREKRNELYYEYSWLIPHVLYKKGLATEHRFAYSTKDDLEQSCAILLLDCIERLEGREHLLPNYFLLSVYRRLKDISKEEIKIIKYEENDDGVEVMDTRFEERRITKLYAEYIRDQIREMKDGEIWLYWIENDDVSLQVLREELGETKYGISKRMQNVSRIVRLRAQLDKLWKER